MYESYLIGNWSDHLQSNLDMICPKKKLNISIFEYNFSWFLYNGFKGFSTLHTSTNTFVFSSKVSLKIL